MASFERQYEPVALALNHVSGDRHRRMHDVADVFWRFFKDFGVSWIGFYTKVEDQDEMVLGASRDSLACSPIAMHGACGMCYLKRRPIIVTDVHNLGEHYIACDPRDRSEVLVPLFGDDGKCYGVLDVDSHQRNAFGEIDVIEMRRIMESTGISWPAAHLPPLVL